MQIKVYTINVKLPGWLRRTLVLGVVPAVMLGICAIVYATSVSGQPDFAAGDPLSASSLNAHLGALQSQIDTANGKVTTIQQSMLAPDANGNVGIGTTNPIGRFDVVGTKSNVGTYDNNILNIYDDTAMTSNAGGSISLLGKYTGSTYTQFAAISAYKVNATDGDFSGGLKFNTRNNGSNPATAMAIDNLGRVGIGTTNPGAPLHVNGAVFIEGDNTVPLTIGGARFGSNGLGGFRGLSIDTYNGGFLSDRVFIDGNGSVGIKTTSPQYALDVTGTIRGDNVTPSDRSLKKNIEPLPTDTLSRVCKINGVSFEWDRQKLKENLSIESSAQTSTNAPDVDGFPKTPQIGLIAQDVEKVFPSLVETDGKGVKSIHYMGVTAVLLEAVKTQQQQIEGQRKQIEELKSRMRALEETRVGARAAQARPTQHQARRGTIGLDQLTTRAPGA